MRMKLFELMAIMDKVLNELERMNLRDDQLDGIEVTLLPPVSCGTQTQVGIGIHVPRR